MTNQELCTQYELLIALIETNNTDRALEVLKNAVARINKSEESKSKTRSGNEHSKS